MNNIMKSFLLASVVILLSACGGVKHAQYQDRFKDTEYYILAQIETHSRILSTECKDEYAVRERLKDIHFQLELLSTYSFFLPEETNTYKISQLIVDDVKAMQTRYDTRDTEPSLMYCKVKSKVIMMKTRKVLETFGIIWTQERKTNGRY